MPDYPRITDVKDLREKSDEEKKKARRKKRRRKRRAKKKVKESIKGIYDLELDI